MSEYIIGVDLGTTNSVVGYTEIEADEPQVRLLPIPQLIAAGTIESRPALPSFLYLGTQRELEAKSLDLPWAENRDFAVGEFARLQAAELPDRTIGAAKSWLAHSKVDRHAEILPWQAAGDAPKVSPVTASQRFLEHLIAAWEMEFPQALFKDQVVVLTVPASFDAAARDLTREAALAAGFPGDLVLLEEPQAAVYAWLERTGQDWRKSVNVGDRLLVCDIGGGTTDLTLVAVEEENGELILTREAVGDHLLVGGDNMDLALAHHAAELFQKKKVSLDAWQSVSLWHACRLAKEKLLAADGPKSHPVSVLGRGSKMIGGTISVDLSGKAAQKLLSEGFFPQASLDDKPTRSPASGFLELGLPWEQDTGITRHIAEFLTRHASEGEPAAAPTHLLCNGGVFRSAALSKRLTESFSDWFGEPPVMLTSDDDLDNAVARGAAYYGWAKHNGGIRIRGGTARAYYVGIETAGLAVPGAPRPMRALCVVPMGMEEGTETDVPSAEFGLVVGEPARFRFFSSNTRRDDTPGDLLGSWQDDELTETDSLEATLTKTEDIEDSYVPVTFRSNITELGIFELWCVQARGEGQWKLEFSVREE